MKAILIPVKEFHQAKKRLAPHFPSADRAALAAAMCKDFFGVASRVAGIDRIYVISKEPRALSWARAFGWETIEESEQVSESASVDAAARYCASRGVETILRLPIDIPVATAPDIEAVFDQTAQCESGPAAVIVPSGDGTGTNALLRRPPDLFPSHFGPNSFALHLAEANRCGARVRIFRNPRLELDVDEAEDLGRVGGFLRPNSATVEWFRKHSLVSREPAPKAPSVAS